MPESWIQCIQPVRKNRGVSERISVAVHSWCDVHIWQPNIYTFCKCCDIILHWINLLPKNAKNFCQGPSEVTKFFIPFWYTMLKSKLLLVPLSWRLKFVIRVYSYQKYEKYSQDWKWMKYLFWISIWCGKHRLGLAAEPITYETATGIVFLRNVFSLNSLCVGFWTLWPGLASIGG